MYINRANQIIPKVINFVDEGDTVLDIGCGTGVISGLIRDKKHTKSTLVDVQYNTMCEFYPVMIYDGKKLPFKKNAFKKSLLITVLHHCSDAASVLKEAARVTEDKIIIVEDIFDNFLGRAITFIGDCLVNWEIHSPFINHSKANWLKIFRTKNFKVVHTEQLNLRCIGFPFKLGIFVLEKSKHYEKD